MTNSSTLSAESPSCKTPITFKFLGQAGVLFDFGGTLLVIDPYLSNSVAECLDPNLQRQLPIPIAPEGLADTRWICLTHVHQDHTDPWTLLPLSKAARGSLFFAPPGTAQALMAIGIAGDRIRIVAEHWSLLGPGVEMRAVPAAHTSVERDPNGQLVCCGYLFRASGRLLYHAGDTMPNQEIVSSVARDGPPNLAFLPCNERNVYRDRAGIVGNMSIREMLAFAAEVRAKRVVALHWDMFRRNSALPEEIALVAKVEAPGLSLLIPRCGRRYDAELQEIGTG